LNIEAITATIYDDYYNLNSADNTKISRKWVNGIVIIVLWLAGIPYYLNSGIIWLDIMDFYLFTFIG